MKKFAIPKKIRIGGFDYIIEYPFEFDTNDYFGKTSFYNTVIKLANKTKGYKLKKSIIIETLVHELVHAIDMVYLGAVLEEEDVERLSKILVMFFKHSDFSLLDDTIPTKLCIMNEEIEVINDYEFEDSDNSYQLNPLLGEFLINTEGQTIPRVKHGILELCINRMINVLYIDNEELSEENKLHAFTSGIFQVFSDNPKVEMLIKEWA